MLLWLSVNAGLLLLAYVLGSIPSGYWAGKWIKGIDIRSHGSGSTGATNVLRTVGKLPALVVLLVDVLKGAAAIGLVRWVYTSSWGAALAPTQTTLTQWLPWITVAAGLLAVLGHSLSVFLNFTGGKSVATSLGLLLAMEWRVGLGTLATFLVMLALSRTVSLSSMTGAIAVIGLMLLMGQPLPYLLFAIAGGVYVIYRHRANIQRLLAGTEPKLGQPMAEATQVSESSS
jgi:glycerol-3-phosphate acyltransferase PlsY